MSGGDGEAVMGTISSSQLPERKDSRLLSAPVPRVMAASERLRRATSPCLSSRVSIPPLTAAAAVLLLLVVVVVWLLDVGNKVLLK